MERGFFDSRKNIEMCLSTKGDESTRESWGHLAKAFERQAEGCTLNLGVLGFYSSLITLRAHTQTYE